MEITLEIFLEIIPEIILEIILWNNIPNPGNQQVNGGFHIGFQFHGVQGRNNGFQMRIQQGDFDLQQFGAQLGNGLQENGFNWNGQAGN